MFWGICEKTKSNKYYTPGGKAKELVHSGAHGSNHFDPNIRKRTKEVKRQWSILT